jgi:hypothetical protein
VGCVLRLRSFGVVGRGRQRLRLGGLDTDRLEETGDDGGHHGQAWVVGSIVE